MLGTCVRQLFLPHQQAPTACLTQVSNVCFSTKYIASLVLTTVTQRRNMQGFNSTAAVGVPNHYSCGVAFRTPHGLYTHQAGHQTAICQKVKRQGHSTVASVGTIGWQGNISHTAPRRYMPHQQVEHTAQLSAVLGRTRCGAPLSGQYGLVHSCGKQRAVLPHNTHAHVSRVRAARLMSSAAAAVGSSLTVLPAAGCWSDVERWVVFSDLHVSLKTCSTCLEVLRTVRTLAEERKAGVLFLGDFWDARGSLPVEPLNAVLEEFRNWSQPMIMLVGNHDQVSLGGQMHSLDPFSVAFPHFKIMSEPSLFLGALWLPYRRREEALKQAINESNAGFNAIFAHADIIGAQWNATYQGNDGLPPDLFPGAVPVYTGHYHIPHTVKGTNITYVGSPYQVSMSETQQQKRLLLLDKHFQLIEEIPVTIGPKYHGVSGLDVAIPPDLNPGDFLRWKLPTSEVPAEVAERQAQLAQQGIHVEVVVQPKSSSPRIEAAEQLSPQQLLQQYAISTGMSDEALERAVHILKSSSLGTFNQLSPPIQLELEEMEISGYGPFKDTRPVTYPLGNRGLRVVSGCNEDDDSTDSNGAGKTSLVMAAYWAITGAAYSRSEVGSKGQLKNHQILNEKSKKCTVTLTGKVNLKPFNITRTLMKSKSSLSFQLDGEDATQQDMRMTQQRVDEVFASSLLPHTVFFGQSNIVGLLEANDSMFKAKLGEIVDWTMWEELHELARQQFREAEMDLRSAEEGYRSCGNRAEQLRGQSEQLRKVVELWEQQQQQDKDSLEAELQRCKQRLQEQAMSIAELCNKLETQVEKARSMLQATSQQQQVDDARAIQAEIERLQQNERDVHGEYDNKQRTFMGEAVEARQRCMELNRTAYTIQGQLQAADLRLQQYEALGAYKSTPSSRKKLPLIAGADSQELQGSPVQLLVHDHPHDPAGVVCDKCLQQVDPTTYETNLQRMREDIEHLRVQHQQHLDDVAGAERDAQLLGTQLLQCEEQQRALVQQLRYEMQTLQSRLQAAQQQAAVQQSKLMEQRSMIDVMAALAGRGQMTVEAAQQLVSLPGHQPQLASLTQGSSGAGDGMEDVSQASMVMDRTVSDVSESIATYRTLQQRLDFMAQRVCLDAARLEQVLAMLEREEAELAGFQTAASGHKRAIQLLAAVVEAFGRSGIPSFVLEGVLGELQDRTATYTAQLASGMALVLNATKPTKSKTAKKDMQEQIDKFVKVKVGDTWRERGIEQLSGGERRRVALALALAFAELAAQRGKFSCNLIVLDEILQQLDQEGCSRVAEVLKALPHSSVLVVGQAHSFVTQEFDVIDVVVKSGGTSTVRLG